MAVKVVYIVSEIRKALAFEWIVDQIDRQRFDLHFILIGEKNTPMAAFLRDQNVPSIEVENSGKTNWPRTWLTIYRYLRATKPDVVHAHLFVANLLGLSAAWWAGIPRRIHTRHHGSLHHRYFPSTVKYDKLVNRLSTDIVVPCSRQREIVVNWEHTPANKVRLIYHGFDLQYFRDRNGDEVRKRYKIPGDAYPVVGVIARYTEWKGVHHVIAGFSELLAQYPQAHLVLANAGGDFADTIRQRLQQLPHTSFTEITFEPDISALYKTFNLFVHAPIDEYSEAFGQTYVESLAAGVPAVFTLSGIACEFIVDGENALVVPYQDPTAISRALTRLGEDSTLRESLANKGIQSVTELFSLSEMIGKLELLYSE